MSTHHPDEKRPLLQYDPSVRPVTPGSSAILGTMEASINQPGEGTPFAEVNSYGGTNTTSANRSKGESNSHGKAEHNIGWSQIDRRRKILLLFLCVSGMLGALSVSILTPFFPEEAAKKHLSFTDSSWIFSIFAVIEFIFCPLWGLFLPSIGVRFMYTASTVFSSGSTFLFGILDEIPGEADNGMRFMVMCLVVRACESIGVAAYLTAVFAIIASEFRDCVTTAFSLVETFHGVGFVLGPPLGGLLYQVGGYKLPFMVLGALLFVTSLSNCLFVPLDANAGRDVSGGGEGGSTGSTNPFAMIKLLRIPLVLMLCLVVIWVAFIGGSVQPTFEPYLKEAFGLNPALVGAVLFAYCVSLTVFTPICGIICQKVPNYIVLTVGCFAMFVGVGFFAPTLLIFPEGTKNLPVLIGAMIVAGAGAAAINVPTMELWIDSAILDGWPNSIALHGLVSGMWSAADALGTFIGPVMGAQLVEDWGFQNFFTYIAGVPLILGLLCVLLIVVTCGGPLKLKQQVAEKMQREALEEETAGPLDLEAGNEEQTPRPPSIEVSAELEVPSTGATPIPVPALRAATAPVRSAEDEEELDVVGPIEGRTLLARQRALEARYLLASARFGGFRPSASHLRFSRPSIVDVAANQRAEVRARRMSHQVDHSPFAGAGRPASELSEEERKRLFLQKRQSMPAMLGGPRSATTTATSRTPRHEEI